MGQLSVLTSPNELSMSGDLEDHHVSPMYGCCLFVVQATNHEPSRGLGPELSHLCDKPPVLSVSVLHLKCILS